MLFDDDIQIRGRHASYLKALSELRGNASEEDKKRFSNFKLFTDYISVYMVAPIIGLLYGKKSAYDNEKDSAGIMLAAISKNRAHLKYIYRLVILSDTTLNLSDEDKINMAFREESNDESVARGMELYNAYFCGGLEILYQEFVERCTTDEDYIERLFEFVSEFKEEQKIDDVALEIGSLLDK